jgi:peptide/nickel transport system permease protein
VRLDWVAGPGRLDAGMAPPPHVTGLYTVDALFAGDLGDLLQRRLAL